MMDNNNNEPAIGIDLGTTYCCVAVFKDGLAEVIANEQGSRITASTVAFTSRERLVGEAAQYQRLLDPANVVHNSKRFIGRKFDDPVVQENKTKYPFKFQDSSNKVNFKVSHLDKDICISPEEVGAALLEKMKKTPLSLFSTLFLVSTTSLVSTNNQQHFLFLIFIFSAGRVW